MGRFTDRWRTPSWCRSARFSSWSATRDLKVADTALATTLSLLSVERRTSERMRNPYVLIQFDVCDRDSALICLEQALTIVTKYGKTEG